MQDINSVTIIGRLAQDCKFGDSNGAYCFFTVATTTGKYNVSAKKFEEENHFVDCVVFGKRAEAIQGYLVKGKQVGVQGTVTQRRNKEGLIIKVDYVQLLGGGKPQEEKKQTIDDDQIPF